MLRAVLGLAVITTMVVLSPVREKLPGNTLAATLPETGQLTEVASRLAPDFLGAKGGTSTPDLLSGQVVATAAPVARQIAASSLEPVRRITISPPPIPLDMPPLRHGRD